MGIWTGGDAGDVAVLDQVDKVHLSNNLKETGE